MKLVKLPTIGYVRIGYGSKAEVRFVNSQNIEQVINQVTRTGVRGSVHLADGVIRSINPPKDVA